uniref:Uncharacterized protein n=2 Tax=Picea TaxID=3328 RepID=A0A117NFG2_PICGL|nr:hypothetical protein ABT39_MTgene3585 [Picea glauca]KUM46622.1 hypothetical protein ABT39_MTgene1302 [Picea glauca]KUM48077.1 hypothetical protein ABT39_MTgene5073 [Picea glauca]QHR89795.1 hypothetical protein Q903MT_gene3817 [Picea sitchensis]
MSDWQFSSMTTWHRLELHALTRKSFMLAAPSSYVASGLALSTSGIDSWSQLTT